MATIDWAKLGSVLDEPVTGASVDTNVSMSHSGMNLSAALGFQPSPSPAAWQVTPNGDGLTIAYTHESSDDARDAMHIRSENGSFNYTMSGGVTGDTSSITVSLSAQATLALSVSLGPSVDGVPLNSSLTMPYTITLQKNGRYQVDPGTPMLSNMGEPVDLAEFANAGVELTDETEGLVPYVMQVFEYFTQLAGAIESVLNPQQSTPPR